MSLSDEQWAKISPLLPVYKPSPKGGRPRLDKRKVLEGIAYVFKHRVPWKEVPEVYGSGTALNDYFREWAQKGAFHRIREECGSLSLRLDLDKIESLKERFSHINED